MHGVQSIQMHFVENNIVHMTLDKKIEFMNKVAEQFFQTTDDEDQIPIHTDTYKKLDQLSQQTLFFEEHDGAPVGWAILIPTTNTLKEQFLSGYISERVLFEKTKPQEVPEAVYLCSAFVLPEHRNKKIAFSILSRAIQYYQHLNPTASFFGWKYSDEGEKLFHSLEKNLHIAISYKL